MTEPQSHETAAAICDLFEKIGPAVKSAIVQELQRGNYDPAKVICWANWRRVETTTFELTELRQEFKADQPKPKPDGATSQWQRQRHQIDADYAAGQAERDEMKKFFETADDESLDLLKAEFMVTCPDETRMMLESKSPRSSNFLRQGIWAIVKKHTHA